MFYVLVSLILFISNPLLTTEAIISNKRAAFYTTSLNINQARTVDLMNLKATSNSGIEPSTTRIQAPSSIPFGPPAILLSPAVGISLRNSLGSFLDAASSTMKNIPSKIPSKENFLRHTSLLQIVTISSRFVVVMLSEEDLSLPLESALRPESLSLRSKIVPEKQQPGYNDIFTQFAQQLKLSPAKSSVPLMLFSGLQRDDIRDIIR